MIYIFTFTRLFYFMETVRKIFCCNATSIRTYLLLEKSFPMREIKILLLYSL